MSSTQPIGFADLKLPSPLLQALSDVGYEKPSAIQAATIPPMLTGVDVLGQAQTGTGKTAAFALPILARLDGQARLPQALVLAPTRELAIQVAEAFQKYAAHLQGFRVLPLYGGADYRGQLRQLQRGVQVVVGTPGRVMDHMRRGSLDLSNLSTLVLDEADEMLRMGFIDDVEWILTRTPATRQIALFSATMPEAIRRIARTHLNSPQEVSIEVKTVTNQSIRQRVWMMAGVHKLDALTRILEVEDFDGVIVFVRTRIATTELAEKLAARGYSTVALNGDVPQNQRESIVEKFKAGRTDILVATDVAARGLDVERVSHVINYDIPYDVEAYIHRIGRTGRAGRSGEAILFAANRERRLLRAIEKATAQTIEKMELPSAEQVTDKRIGKFKEKISEILASTDLGVFRKLVEDYQHEYGVPVIEIAAALGAMAQGGKPLTAKTDARHGAAPPPGDRAGPESASAQEPKPKTRGKPTGQHKSATHRRPNDRAPDVGMERYRIEVGRQHGVRPGNIVGAIANEADLDAEHIGRVDIHDSYSTVDLPEGMPKPLLRHLRNVWVSGQRLQMSRLADDGTAEGGTGKGRRKAAGGGGDGKGRDSAGRSPPRRSKPRS